VFKALEVINTDVQILQMHFLLVNNNLKQGIEDLYMFDILFNYYCSLCDIRIGLCEKFQSRLDISLYKIAYHRMGKEIVVVDVCHKYR